VNPKTLSLAERVVREADRVHPADAVLRETLKSQPGLARRDASEVSRLVFSYFRWRGWLNERHPLGDQLKGARDLAKEFSTRPQTFADSDLTARAVPEWINDEVQVTAEFVRALQAEPGLFLRARPGKGAALARRLKHCRVVGPGPLADTLEYCGREDLFRTAEFHAGGFELQDLSSQAVGLVCAPTPGETWWDACAGEGGKMLHLSDLMHNKGLIWATDRAEWRLRRLKRRAARAKVFNYRTALWECAAKLPTKTKFDGVLVDAPCSGIGTWQRNPHARWTLTAQDLKALHELQTRLLAHSAKAVKPGGKLVYSVCSLARSETDAVLKDFDSAGLPFTPVMLTNPLAPETPPAARLVLPPQQFGGNGMFIAAWLKRTMT
jgi:16S rRNA (cytosine967-C5)-methyltransferase